MKASIGKSNISGRVTPPPSKSYTIRSMMCSALADGESRIFNPLTSDDTKATAEVLGQLGVYIKKEDNWWQIRGGHLHTAEGDLFCRDSAATFRFMTAIASIIPGRCQLVPGKSLASRPIKPLLTALAQLGLQCKLEDNKVIIDGSHLQGGTVKLPGNISSQFISALLLISPLSEGSITIQLTTPPSSKPYLGMTLECLKKFGIAVETSDDLELFQVFRQDYKPAEYIVEGDWSSASYLLALGVISGYTEVTGLNINSFQGDRIMINLLQEMGAEVVISENLVTVQKSRLKAITTDLSNCIDLLPTMAVLAAVADGESIFSGISQARLKESNRVHALRDGLSRMGIAVTDEGDRLIITGSKPSGATIDSFSDHRIAMAFSILGSLAGNTTIEKAECVAKTYPDFWHVFIKLGGKVNLDVK